MKVIEVTWSTIRTEDLSLEGNPIRNYTMALVEDLSIAEPPEKVVLSW